MITSERKIIVKLMSHPDGPYNIIATFTTDIAWMVDEDDNLVGYKGDKLVITFASEEWECIEELIK